MILSTAYFPPAGWFAALASSDGAQIEAYESYRKQTWRNRCRILAPGGPEDLRVPVRHDGSRLITDIKVDWSTPWLRQTEYAIDTAYYSSPFFEYYRDELFALLDRRPERLWDLNRSIIEFFCRKIGLVPPVPTSGWAALAPDDLREAFSPKRPSPWNCRPYWQVFREKYGFVDGLSVMDLLFNEGPESLGYLK